MMRYSCVASRFGTVCSAVSDRGVCALEFADEREFSERLHRRYSGEDVVRVDPYMLRAQKGIWADQLRASLHVASGQADSVDIAIDLVGTPFQRQVWQALRQIPYGVTSTYAEVAKAIGRPTAARAVAAACASNRVAVLVPCHRVLRSDGQISGYRWGVDVKRGLLDMESGRSTE